jgi:predicted unusual protein kinase regulating ubiquinone biosynthesis (AarF/ABC1/UbiB family)
MALQDGFLHGDLHPGNLFIQLQGTLEDGGCGTNKETPENGMNSWYMNLIHGMNYGIIYQIFSWCILGIWMESMGLIH